MPMKMLCCRAFTSRQREPTWLRYSQTIHSKQSPSKMNLFCCAGCTGCTGCTTEQGVGNWIGRLGRPANREPNSAYQRIADLRVSTTDPDATLMRKKGGRGAHLGYHTHYAVDGGKTRIILKALVTPAEVQDNQPMLDLLWRVCFRWHLRPKQITGDTKYGTIENIVAVEQQGIRAYVPLPNWENKTRPAISVPITSHTIHNATLTSVRKANYCAAVPTSTRSGRLSIVPVPRIATPACSRRNAHRATMGE